MKFLLCAYTGLGNFILQTPLVRAIHEQFPGSELDLICGSPWGADQVLLGSKWIRQIHWFPPGILLAEKLRMFQILRREHYDVVLCPFDSTPSMLRRGMEALGAQLVISHVNFTDKSSIGVLRTAFRILRKPHHKWVPVLAGRHECDLNLDLLEPLLKQPTQRDLHTFVHWETEDLLSLELPERFFALQPSACNGQPTPKTWDPRNFVEVIKLWKEIAPDDQFVLVGDEGDSHMLKEVELPRDGVINLLGKTSFNQLCNVLHRAKIVVAHDSGIMHVANALQRPLLALYGPTDFTRTQPLAPTSHILHSHTDCWAQMYAFGATEVSLAKKYTPYHCMSGITALQVTAKMQDIMNSA